MIGDKVKNKLLKKEIKELDNIIHNSIIELMKKYLKFRYVDLDKSIKPKTWECQPSFLWHNSIINKDKINVKSKNQHYISEGDMRSHLFYLIGAKKFNGYRLVDIPEGCKTCFLHSEVRIHKFSIRQSNNIPKRKYKFIDLIICDPWNLENEYDNGFIIRGIEIKVASENTWKKGGLEDLWKLKNIEKNFKKEYGFEPKSYWVVLFGKNLKDIKEPHFEPNGDTVKMIKLIKKDKRLNVQLYFLDEYDETIYQYNKELKVPIIAKRN